MHRRVLVVAGLAAVALPGALAGTAGGQGAAKQTIGMKEFTFTVPANVKAGSTAVTFRNTGQFPHNFTVVAALGGAKAFKSATVAPGKTQTRTINLRPGAYVAICTVFNGFHLSRGMQKRFTIGKFDQSKGTWGP